MTNYLTATQAAERLGTSLTNVARWCRDGTLPATRLGIGRIWQIPVEAVEAFTPPARGPKPVGERKRLLDLAKDIIAEFVNDPFGEIKQPGWDFMTKELARRGQCSRARARQALAKAIRLARAPKPECPYCKGTGMTDSGGFDAQDRPISIPCPYCEGAK